MSSATIQEAPKDLFIDNRWVKTDQQIETLNPADESVLASVSVAGEAEVDAAVAAARRALENPEWRDMKPVDRGRLLMRISQLASERSDELGEVEMLDSGKPRQFAHGAAGPSASRYFEYFAGAADKLEGATIPLGPDYIDFTLLEPLGVTAHILPWNVPLSMLARGVAPALAVGCTAIIKPAEQTPLGALQMAKLFADAGVPPGVVNIVNGPGETTGAYLASHPGIDGITFTGSVATGQEIMRLAAKHVKPTVLELGGKSPILVFADADPRIAAEEVCKGIYLNSGQFCDASSRVFVDRRLEDDLLGELQERSAKISVGNPTDNPDMGPLISAEQHKRVLDYIEIGRKEGASVVCGGGRPDGMDRGYYVSPTVFKGAAQNMRISREEIFGPVLCTDSFDDEEEALARANDSNYGLAAGIFTRDLDRALRLTTRLKAGTIYVNEYFSGDVSGPFGGYKQSGIGRERGWATLSNYTQIKNVIVRVRPR